MVLGRRGMAPMRRCPEVAVALAASAYVACWATGWFSGRLALPVGNTVLLVVPFSGGLLAVVRGLRLRGRARTGWVLCGLSGVFWACGQATYAVYDLVWHATVPFPGPPDVFYLPALPLLAGGVLALPAAPSHPVSRLWFALDGVLVAGTLFTTSWILVLRPLWVDGDSTFVAKATALYYPFGDVVVGALAVLTVTRARRGGDRSLWLLVTGVGLLFGADLGYAVLSLHGGYVTGMPIDVGWAAAYILVGLAARAYRPDAEPPRDAPVSWLAQSLPQLILLPAIPVLYLAFATKVLDVTAVLTGLVTIGALVLRQGAANWDNARLAKELSASEGHFRHLAHHDSLTGLPNRALLRLTLERAIAAHRAPGLLVIDLDGFKQVNDSMGHQAGDTLLVDVAARLRGIVGPGELAARLGGDEFAIVPEPGADLDLLAVRIVDEISRPFETPGGLVVIGASVGVAAMGDGADELLRNADLAMYRAKGTGRGRAARFEPDLHLRAVRRLEVESALRRGIENEEFVLHYQPVVQLASGRAVAAEALVRWRRPGYGLLAPADFLDVAEETGLLVPLGAWVLREGCREAVRWRARGLDLRLSVNVSARQVLTTDLVAAIMETLDESGLPADRLVLEITESVLMGSERRVVRMLERLRDLGVRLAVDDFGTGYSSLSYLRTLPFDVLKIDRSFVAGMTSDAQQQELVGTLVTLGGNLGLDVVAEGVEEAAQAAMLAEMGVTLAQGYHLGRPVLTDGFVSMVSTMAAFSESETAVSTS